MNNRIAFISLGIMIFTSCHNRGGPDTSLAELTPTQQQLLEEGWTIETPDEDLSEKYGIKPIYGIQDNYFDITIGSGCNVAVKIMEFRTDKCIRYIYVAENSSTTVHEIPQGIYFIKLAYGYDWMVLETDTGRQGKFTRNVSYERSQDTFDFGKKNSREEKNYRLEINIVDSKLENNFHATPIDEEEFMK